MRKVKFITSIMTMFIAIASLSFGVFAMGEGKLNVSLITSYTPAEYNITYMEQGGTLDSSFTSGGAYSTYSIANSYNLPNSSQITKTNYNFQGWSENLFDIDETISSEYTVDGNTLSVPYSQTNNPGSYNWQIPVYEGETYTWKWTLVNGAFRPIIQMYNSANENISSALSVDGMTYNAVYTGFYKDADSTYSFVIPNGVAYIKVAFAHMSACQSGNVNTASDIKLFQGTTEPADTYVTQISAGSTTGNKTYRAVWELSNYTISYYSTSTSSTYETQSVAYGNTYSKPSNPTKDGYTFVGWSEGNDNTAEWSDSSSKTCSGDKSWYAVWKKVWTFYDTSSITDTQTVNYAVTASASQSYTKTNPSNSGYTFVGYSTANDTSAETEKGASSTSVSSTSATPTFYAVWKKTDGTHTRTGNLTHTFKKASGVADGTATTGITYTYNNDTVYYNYTCGTSNNIEDDTTVNSTVYAKLSFPSIYTVGTSYSVNSGTYTFAGWSTSNDTSADWTSGQRDVSANTTWYAVWKKTDGTHTRTGSLTHTFKKASGVADGTATTGITYTYNNDTVYYNYTCGTSNNIEDDTTVNSTVYAKLSFPSIYTVGTSYSVNSGTYTFVGWSTGNDTTVEWTSGQRDVSANTTWYAVWKKTDGTHTSTGSLTHTFKKASGVSDGTATTGITYTYNNDTVYYNYTCGTSNNIEDDTSANSTVYAKLSFPSIYTVGTSYSVNSGTYTFAGWSTSNDTSADWTSGQRDVSANTTWYAVWQYTVSVSYNANGGTGNMTASTATANANYTLASKANATVTIKSNTFTRTGYTFSGWNIAANGSGTSYAAGGTYTGNSNITLYAQWTANTYEVTYDANGGSGTMSSTTVTYGETFIAPECNFTRTGYTFRYWTEESTGGTSWDGWIGREWTWTYTRNITLYAQWSANSYTITANANNGSIPVTNGWTGSGATSSKSVEYQSTYGNLPTPTRTGYNFAGWYINSATSTNFSKTQQSGDWSGGWSVQANKNNFGQLTNGKKYIIVFDIKASSNSGWNNYTLFVNSKTSTSLTKLDGSAPEQISTSWKTVRTREFTYNIDTGGTYSSDPIHIYPVMTTGVTYYIQNFAVIPAPTEFTSSADLNTATTTSSIVKTASDHSLYAKWTPINYTISYYSTSTSSTYETQSVAYGNTYSKPSNPSNSGYTFVGWSEGNDKTAEWSDSSSKTCTGDKSWYAVWKKVWTFYDTSSITDTQTVNYAVTASASQSYTKTNPSNSGYTFVGYSTANDTSAETQKGNSSTSVSSTSATPTFYAVWKKTDGTHTRTGSLTHTFKKASGVSDGTATTGITYTYNNDTVYYNYTCGTSNNIEDDTSANSTVYAKLSFPSIYTVGTSYSVNSGTYTFVGWSTGNDTTVEWTSGQRDVSANTTWYAVWSSTDRGSDTSRTDTFTVTFNAGAGSVVNPTYTGNIYYKKDYTRTKTNNYNLSQTSYSDKIYGTEYEIRDTLTIPYQEATLNNYTFEGWHSSGIATDMPDWVGGNKDFTTNTTMYAVWRGFVNIYYVNGDSRQTITEELIYNYTCTNCLETYITLISNPFTKTGYTFAGWSTDGIGTIYQPGDQYIISGLQVGIIEFAAQWTVNTYTITLDANGGTAGTASITATYNATLPTITTLPSRTGYTFNGFYTATSGGSKIINADKTTVASVSGYTDSNKKWIKASNVTLHAQWTAIKYTVKYNGNGATGGSTSDSEHTYDVAKNLTANGYTRAYTVTLVYNDPKQANSTLTATYTFKNWNKVVAGTGTSYTNEQSVTNLTSVANVPVYLYAQWNSASVTLPSPKMTDNTKYYVFGGWYSDANLTNFVSNAGSYTPTANITLYAEWLDAVAYSSTTMESYITIQQAVDATSSSGIVEILRRNVAQNSTVTITRQITIRANGNYTITKTTDGNMFEVSNPVKVTFEASQGYTLSMIHTGSSGRIIGGRGNLELNYLYLEGQMALIHGNNAEINLCDLYVVDDSRGVGKAICCENGNVVMTYTNIWEGTVAQSSSLASTFSNVATPYWFIPAYSMICCNDLSLVSCKLGYDQSNQKVESSFFTIASSGTIRITGESWLNKVEVVSTYGEIYTGIVEISDTINADITLYAVTNVYIHGDNDIDYLKVRRGLSSASSATEHVVKISYYEHTDLSGNVLDDNIYIEEMYCDYLDLTEVSSLYTNLSINKFTVDKEEQIRGGSAILTNCEFKFTTDNVSNYDGPLENFYIADTNDAAESFINASESLVSGYAVDNTVLYPKRAWFRQAKTYDVTFDAGRGTTITGNSGADAASNSTGYTFTIELKTGYKAISCTLIIEGVLEGSYDSVGTYKISKKYIEGDITITTVGTPITYSVKYNANNGSGSMSNSSHTYDSGKALTANAFTRTGYAFKNWNTKADGTGTVYTNSQSVTNLASTQGTVVNLYAQWTPNTITITLDSKYYSSASATGTTVTSSGTTKIYYKYEQQGYYSNATCTTLLNRIETPTYTHYNFSGYYSGKTGTGTMYTTGLGVPTNNLYKAFSSDTTLYAKWTPVNYTITYYDEAGVYTTQTIAYGSTYSLPTDPTYNNYAFYGWSEDEDNTKEWSAGTQTCSGNKTWYAVWMRRARIIGNIDGTNTSPTDYVPNYCKYNGTIPTINVTTPATPTRTGYTFVGWSSSSAGITSSYSASTSIAVTCTSRVTDYNIYAVWKRSAYVTGSYNGTTKTGTTVEKSCAYDQTITSITCNVPGNCSQTGYAWYGWSTSSSVTANTTTAPTIITTVDVSCSKATDNTSTVYAVYKRTWKFYDTSSSAPSITTYYGPNPTASASYSTYKNNPTLSGYTFVGYSTGNDAAAEVTKGDSNTQVSLTTASGNWYAVWSYGVTITYNGNGNTGGSTANSTGTAYASYNLASKPNISITLRANGFTKTGYSFGGWYEDSACTGTKYNANSAYSTNANKTLYAKWTINSYTLKIDPNGGYRVADSSTEVISVTKNYNSTEVISARARTGYTLTGWTIKRTSDNSTSNIGGATITALDSNKSATFTQGTESVTLVAQWTANTYTITLDANGGTAGTASITATYNATLPTITTLPSRTGYTFIGFYTATSGGSKIINADKTTVASVSGYTDSNKKWIKASNVTLHAQWSPKSYSITYWYGSEQNDYSTSSVNYDAEYSMRSTPSKSGYHFVGWSEGVDKTAEWTSSSTKQTCKGDKTWYAVWQRSAKIRGYETSSNDYVDSSSTVTQNCAYNGSITSINVTAPTGSRTGYTFAGWSTSSTGETSNHAAGATVSVTLTSGQETTTLALYAVWSRSAKIRGYKTSSTNYVDNSETPTCAYNGSITSINVTTPTCANITGYIFYGWSNDNNTTVEHTANKSISISVSSESTTKPLYAVWKNSSNTTGTENRTGSYTVTLNAGYGTVSQSTFTGTIYKIINYSMPVYHNYDLSSTVNGEKIYGTETETSRDSITLQYSNVLATYSPYTFMGWHYAPTTADGIPDWPSGSNTFRDTTTMYAVWSGMVHIYYYPCYTGASVHTQAADIVYNYNFSSSTNPTITIINNPFNRTGYQFTGWYSGEGIGVEYQPGDQLTISSDISLDAQWTRIAYTVKFMYVHGTYATYTKYYGDTYSYIASPGMDGQYSWQGYGWTTSTTAATAEWTSGSKTCTGNITWNAISRRSITISFNANGGSGTMSPKTGYVYSNDYHSKTKGYTTTLPCSFTAPSGKQFKIWNTNSYGTGTNYATSSVTFSNSITLYAIWKDIPRGIMVHINNTTTTMSTGQQYVTNTLAGDGNFIGISGVGLDTLELDGPNVFVYSYPGSMVWSYVIAKSEINDTYILMDGGLAAFSMSIVNGYYAIRLEEYNNTMYEGNLLINIEIRTLTEDEAENFINTCV